MLEIPKSQVVARLREDNPWWGADHAIPSMYARWEPRLYLDVFFPQFKSREVRRALVLMGPRRVGKTVLIHHAIQRLLADGERAESLCYISVDHPIYNGLSLEELLDIYGEASGVDFRTTRCFIVFDEIQYLREWEVHLKALVDRYEKPRFVASGSAAAALRLKSAESGAGRITDFLLPPLTFNEFLHLRGQGDLVRVHVPDDEHERFDVLSIDELNAAFVDYLNFGGYPEVVLSQAIQSDPGRYIKSDIIDKVLLRDLPSLYGIQDIQELNSLFTTLAFNTASEVSLEALSKRSGVAKNTIKRYIEYLEAAFLVRIIHRVDRSGKSFRRANYFKVYLTNPSIRCALFSTVSADDDAIGALVETAIYSQFFHGDEALHYARWNGGEVDMVFSTPEGRPAWALEAKWSDRREGSMKNLLSFSSKNKLELAAITTRTNEFGETHNGVRVLGLPASRFCFVAGHSMIRNRRREVAELLSRSSAD